MISDIAAHPDEFVRRADLALQNVQNIPGGFQMMDRLMSDVHV